MEPRAITPIDKQEEQVAKIAGVIKGEFQPYLSQLEETRDRIKRLVSAAKMLHPLVGVDVLRAAVVLTHALLEDFLRTLTRRLLPKADIPALREIPLAGMDGRKLQFNLGHLVQHRGKSVQEVIQQSVDESIERSTFNNTTEIAQLLTALGLDVAEVESRFSLLDQMIRRRHQIVHRADKAPRPGSSTYTLEDIQETQVISWLDATFNFAIEVIIPIAAESVAETLETLRAEGTGAEKGELASRPSVGDPS